jgi:hypothetical protein
MDDITIEQDMYLPKKADGTPDWPRYLACPNCGTMMRRRPPSSYRCRECDGWTTLEIA